jgi:Domain of unknown function (DUF4178)
VSVREANCPSCGARIEFSTAVSVMVVCAHCSTACVRRDVEIEKLGKVAEVAPLESALSLGASGRWHKRRWSAIGQIQLDHGAGPWNEWCLLFEDGETGWLAEAQGEFLVTFHRPDIPSPLGQELAAGSKVALGDETYVVAEEGTARITAARGELSREIVAGEDYQYFDLRGPGGKFATVAVHRDGSVEVFTGESAARSAIAADESTVQRPEARRAATDRLACPSCASPIELRDPANTMRVVCSSCGSMMDPRAKTLRVIEKAKRLESRPVLPIGARCRLRGLEFEVLAFMVRSVRSEGVRYPWDEYLLRRKDGAYQWLVSADGHWTLTETISLGDVSESPGIARWRGETFRHFQGGRATVDHVQGEVYWEVRIGEEVRTNDFVAPPRMLSFEKSGREVVVSVGHYVERAEMMLAFPGVTRWPWARGIAPNQPNPWAAVRGKTWAVGGVLAAAALVLMILFGALHLNREVARVMGVSPLRTAAAQAGSTPVAAEEEKGVVFSDEFKLEPASANVRIRLHASVSNQWLGVDGALVELDTGDVHAFAVEAERWSGVTDGESWSEGDDTSTVYLGSIPAGRYALRLDASGQAQTGGDAAVSYTVVATSQVPSTGRGVLLIVLLAAAPTFVSFAAASFETRRWATSDHAPGGDE